MKKNWKTWIAGGAVLTLLTGTLAIPSLAANGVFNARLEYSDMKVTLNGQTVALADSYGNPVEPFTINGTSYLPVASLSKALGLNVAWDQSTNTIVLTSNSGAQTSAPVTNTSSYIGESKAQDIALNHAGLTASNVTFLRSQLDRDDGRMVYDVEFYSGSKEYDYEIDASTGTILSYDFDVESYVPSTSTNTGSYIGETKAREIALNHAGLTSSSVTFVQSKLDRDDGRTVYDVEFYSGSKEYDYEIDASTGTILSYDFDAENYAPSASINSGSYIGEAKAKQIVEQRAGTTGTYHDFHLERDDGRVVYEGELRSGRTEYDFTIDATTGTILEWEVDR